MDGGLRGYPHREGVGCVAERDCRGGHLGYGRLKYPARDLILTPRGIDKLLVKRLNTNSDTPGGLH